VTAFALPGRTALVTGAARGIGLETARLLHARGASVTLTDLDSDEVGAPAAGIGERTLALAGTRPTATASTTRSRPRWSGSVPSTSS
jgi:NAD(P)-dependent dehydrogenase (short-subunit alcohol dehydrogenase family)